MGWSTDVICEQKQLYYIMPNLKHTIETVIFYM